MYEHWILIRCENMIYIFKQFKDIWNIIYIHSHFPIYLPCMIANGQDIYKEHDVTNQTI